jgi:two-component sensor histidine kinase
MHDLLNSNHNIDYGSRVTAHAEADHRIANSLALIGSSMRLRARNVRERQNLTGAEAAALLDESVARVDAIAHLHRLLSETNGKAKDCADFLRSIGEAAVNVCTVDGETNLHFDLVKGLYLDPSRLAALGLLLNEAVINAHKYAHPAGVDGKIVVSCRPCEGGWSMAIEDDGVGLPDGMDPETEGGLGFKVMRALADNLDGRLIHTSGPLGHRVELILAP